MRLVAPGVEALEVGGGDGGEAGGGFGVVGLELFGEGGGEGRLEVADSGSDCDCNQYQYLPGTTHRGWMDG